MRQQHGRTLIELLVAIALGLLILLGVGGLYMSSNQSTRAATSVATIDNVGQVALTLIGNSIRRAGYSELIGTEYSGLLSNSLYRGPSLRGCREERFAGDDPSAGCPAATGTAGASDAIAVWFQADNALSASQGVTDDCVGSTPPQTTPVGNANYQPRVANIRLVQNNFYVNNGNLVCAGATNTQPLLTGVESLKVYYGFDDFAFANPAVLDINPAARSIRDADFLNAQPAPSADLTAWDFVVSVTVCVLVRTEERGVSTQQAAAVPYQPCPQTAAQAADPSTIPTLTPPTTDPNAGAVRRAFTQTFAVRTRGRPSPLAG